VTIASIPCSGFITCLIFLFQFFNLNNYSIVVSSNKLNSVLLFVFVKKQLLIAGQSIYELILSLNTAKYSLV
jgi:hypothetical protein